MNIRATARHFSFLASCVTGYDVSVNITSDPSYVGFTSMPTNQKANITLSNATPLYRGMDEPHVLMMMLGVLAHECMHLRYTNFDAANRKAIVLSRKADKEAFHEINNVVEDPAAELAASYTIGGKMLKALFAVIKHTWMTSPNIEEGINQSQAESYAYTQVIRAMIQIGDRGCLKGTFLSDTARNAFAKILPIFNEAVVEPDGEKRVEYAVEIYKILEPLSRKEAEETHKQLPNGKPMSMPKGMGEGHPMPWDADESDDNEGQGESSNPSNQSATQKKQELRKRLERTMKKDDGTDDANGAQKDENKPSERDNAGTQQDTRSNEEMSSERPYEASTMDENDLSGIDEDMEFTDEDFESLLNDIHQVETQMQINEAAEQILAVKAKEDLLLDSDDVINCKADNPNEERYNSIVRAYSSKIVTLTNELRKIFMSDRSRVKNSNHGARVNTKRLVDGKLHSNVLLSRTFPKELDDMAVYLLIDKSGSMSKSNGKGKCNDQCAAETAICLYEALHALRIPVYITGFTTRGRKALHMHYVTWNSPSSDKYTLANFAADNCNYDYYSIAEATRVLQRHHAKHKLLIVISDGAPCNPEGGMHSMTGVESTTAAVTQARKTTDVLGVALNCYDEVLYSSMYGKDYITVSTASDMFIPISDTLQKIVKSW